MTDSSPQAAPIAPPTPPMSAGDQLPRPATSAPIPNPATPVVDPLLFIHATAHTDVENLRIATQHRHRILTATEPDDDGVMRGFGLSASHPDVARLAALLAALNDLEHEAQLNLKRSLRRSAIHPWIAAQMGIGEKQGARLLGVIGDPYWHLSEDRPRTVSQLWAYCGLHVLPASHSMRDAQSGIAGGGQAGDPARYLADVSGNQCGNGGVAPQRRRGVQSNWSTEAKTRAYLIAAQCIKYEGGEMSNGMVRRRSPYRDVYDERRAHTAETHPDWTAGHSHNDALRITSKAILRDLWREARRLHGVGSDD